MNSVKNFSDKIKSFFASLDFQNYHISSKKIYYIAFFILPFLTLYEIGLFWGTIKGINGADAILRIFSHFFYEVLGIDTARIIFAFIIIGFLSYFLYCLKEKKIEIRPRFFLYNFIEQSGIKLMRSSICSLNQWYLRCSPLLLYILG